MSASFLRALPQRTPSNLLPSSLTPPSRFSHGRTAAYRRIASRNRLPYNGSSLRWNQQKLTTPVLLFRSHPPTPIPPAALGSVRQVSFKELREERARQKTGGATAESTQRAKPSATSEPEPEPQPQQPESTWSAADEAFAQSMKYTRAEWDRFAKEQRRAEEEAKATGDAEGGSQKPKPEPDAPEQAPHGNKSPWQVFTDTLSTEFKTKEWSESTRQLSGSIHDITQKPGVQKVKTAYTKAAEAASSTTGKVIMGTASTVGKGATWTWETPVVRGVRTGAKVVGSGVEKATRPIRETEAYKNVKEVVDDGASQRYGGWVEKEERKRRRERREAQQGAMGSAEKFEEDPNAGTNVTLHKDSAWTQGWRNFRDNSPVMQRVFGLGTTYRDSDNPLISTARSVSDRIAGFFAETETARVIKKFREMDPSFRLEPFLTEMRTYILPEVLEAYVQGDAATLKLWLSTAQYQVYHALMQQYTQHGLKSDGRILDIRGVDIISARVLDPGEIPVFVLMARTQEVHVYRKAKTGELAAGMEDKVQQVTYAIGVTRIPEDVSNPETRGWKLIELQKSARDYI